MNPTLRTLGGLCISLGLAAGAFAAPGAASEEAAMIRVEPEVQAFTESSAGVAKAKRPRAKRAAPVQLEAPAPGEGLPDRAAGKGGVPLQIGFNRNVPGFDDEATTVSRLEWEAQPAGGYLGALSINSPGAAALRLGLRVNHVPAGAILRFYGPGDEKLFEVTGEQIADTVARNLDAGESGREARTYWSPVIESATIVMEIELPAGAKPSELRIAAPEISHLVTSSRMDFQVPKTAAACEIDAMCQAGTWGNQMNAVARMVFSTGSGSFLCTGTLLADQDPSTTIPYFLSANHCISSASAAGTLQTYWFYRSTSCNSGIPGSSVTLTGGATLLYASANTDTSFMRLNSTPPGGAVYAGWAVGAAGVGAATTALHHPGGDLLKISGGSIQGYWTCTPSTSGQFSCDQSTSAAGTFYANALSSGITEGGSSGSGLFLNNGGYLIGQLYGGTTSCTTPGTDFYGRLDTAYAAGLNAWLGAGQPPPAPNLTLAVGRTGAGTGVVSSSPAGINCGSTCSASFGQGSVVSLTAVANAGSTFGGWSGACSGTSASCSVTMSSAKSVDANFGVAVPPPAPQYALAITKSGSGTGTVTSSPAGINCGATCNANFASGTTVSLTATPASGSIFSGWSGACFGTGACTVTMSAAKAVEAVFSLPAPPPPSPSPPATYPLSVSIAGTGSGSVFSSPPGISCGTACSANFAQGSTVSLMPSPAPGSTFSSWSGLCSGSGACVVPMSAAASVTANFSASAPVAAPTMNYTDMWWSANESGWGLNVIQHASGNIFAIWYTYGPDGKRVWYHMPGGTWSSSNTFTGTIYATAGPPFSTAFDPSRVTRTTVGSGILTFSDANNGTWRYSINGIAGVKTITRLQY